MVSKVGPAGGRSCQGGAAAARRLRRHLLGLLAGLLVPAAAGAQGFESYVSFTAACSLGSIRLELAGHDDGRRPDVVGFDIVRQVHGSCETPLRVTAGPIPRPQVGNFSLVFADFGTSTDVMYRYRAFGVDASRTLQVELATIYVNSEGRDSTYAGCGVPEVGHGRVVVLGPAWYLQACASSCAPSLGVSRLVPGLEALVGTGVAVRLFGDIVSTLQGDQIVPTRFTISPCGTAVARSSWQDLKILYRPVPGR